MTDEKKISKIIKILIQAMTKGDLSNLDLYFHENIKIIAPDLKILGDGKKICIQSYVDFIKKAQIQKYEDNIENIFIYDSTAIVFYRFTMAWKMEQQSHSEEGKELYILIKKDSRWQIILRKLITVNN